MFQIYCISGMGVDERLFQNLHLNNCVMHHIKWLTPIKDELLADYAIRLSAQIDQSKPFLLIGVSFGGMCCSEIALKLNPLKTFLISSCKKSDELPKFMKFQKLLPIYKILNNKSFIHGATLTEKRFGMTTKEEATLFEKMLETAPPNYFKGAVNCIVNWKESETATNIIHIHGTSDKVLPYNKIQNCNYTIKNGTHWMVMDKAEEISKIINDELEKLN